MKLALHHPVARRLCDELSLPPGYQLFGSRGARYDADSTLIAAQAQRLIPEVAELFERALKLEQEHGAGLQRVAVGTMTASQPFALSGNQAG